MDGIKEILDKISTYNIFNYLLPGILFVFISKETIGLNLVQENNFIGVFLYYFIGMIISRVGSIFIEPFLKKVAFLKFSDYTDFVIASKKDSKIELLSEVNNTYRTLLSMLLIIVCLRSYLYLKQKWGIAHNSTTIFIIAFLILLFLFSYRKQTNYITKRIKINNQP